MRWFNFTLLGQTSLLLGVGWSMPKTGRIDQRQTAPPPNWATRYNGRPVIWQTPYIWAHSLFLSVQYSAADWSDRSLLPAVLAWLTTLRFWSGKSLLFQHLQRERGRECGGRKIDQSFILSLYQPQRWLPELCVYVPVSYTNLFAFRCSSLACNTHYYHPPIRRGRERHVMVFIFLTWGRVGLCQHIIAFYYRMIIFRRERTRESLPQL